MIGWRKAEQIQKQQSIHAQINQEECVFTKERGKVYLCSRLAQRQPSNSCPIGWERAQGLSALMPDQLLRANLCIFSLPRAPVPPMMRSQQDTGANAVWEELTIHQIMAITAFPFHWNPSGDTHTRVDPLLYLRQGPPGLLLSCSLGSRRLMSTGPVRLFSRRDAPIHPRALL